MASVRPESVIVASLPSEWAPEDRKTLPSRPGTLPAMKGRGRSAVSLIVYAAFTAALVAGSFSLASLLRFGTETAAWPRFGEAIGVLVAVRVITLGVAGELETLWRYTEVPDVVRLAGTTAAGTGLVLVAGAIFWRMHLFPSVFIIEGMTTFVVIGAARLSVRAVHRRRRATLHRAAFSKLAPRRAVVIVGAGDAGELLIREIQGDPSLRFRVAALVDDDAHKQGRRIHGTRVLGIVDELPSIATATHAEEVLLALPAIDDETRARIVARARETALPVRTVPSLGELIAGSARIANLQPVVPEDLLPREPVKIDETRMREAFGGRSILVTGAAGSIGSEICRQLARMQPGTLILFDRAESPLYFLSLELAERYPDLHVVPAVGDVSEPARVGEVVDRFRPGVIFHAAAYKHVPLMESHPLEGIRNNVFGTEVVARAAAASGVETFVMISTDKAVRPVGVMGMTKRVAEDIASVIDGRTRSVVVRFGNVLGSEGSVLPLFQRQLERGGPLTVTDPDATRYFMLISEAAQLVLQAAVIGRPGQVLLLDMGEPVRIAQLAENLIRLSGLTPEKDVPLEVVGLRPGERLTEELIGASERVVPSEHERIKIVEREAVDAAALAEGLDTLRTALRDRDEGAATVQLAALARRGAMVSRPEPGSS